MKRLGRTGINISKATYVYTVPSTLELAVNNMIVFIPAFRGYGLSTGSVPSGYGDYVDTRNGLAALQHVQGLKTNGHFYVVGASLGGFVALRLASHLPHVQAVELVSPYPGTRLFLAWAKTHWSQLDDTISRISWTLPPLLPDQRPYPIIPSTCRFC